MEALGDLLVTADAGDDMLPGGLGYQLIQLGEEGLEVAGVLVALWAVLDEFRTAWTPQGLVLRGAIGAVRRA